MNNLYLEARRNDPTQVAFSEALREHRTAEQERKRKEDFNTYRVHVGEPITSRGCVGEP